MSILRLVGVALAAVMMILVLRKENGNAALAVAAVAGVIIMLSVINDLVSLIGYVRGLVSEIPSASDNLAVLLKNGTIFFDFTLQNTSLRFKMQINPLLL